MKKFLLLESVLIVVILMVGWFFGARTAQAFSQALFWGGCVVMGLGMISLIGQWGARTDSAYVIARTVTDQEDIYRARQSFSDITATFGFLFETLILGGIPVIISLVLNWLLK